MTRRWADESHRCGLRCWQGATLPLLVYERAFMPAPPSRLNLHASSAQDAETSGVTSLILSTTAVADLTTAEIHDEIARLRRQQRITRLAQVADELDVRMAFLLDELNRRR